MRKGWWMTMALIGLGLAPLIGVAMASGLARLGGCALSAARPLPCVLAGIDWGGALYRMLVSASWIAVTSPLALAGFALGIGLALRALHLRLGD